MLLQDWLSQEDLSYAQFGNAVSRTAEAVRRYANGERIPDRETMAAIVRETSGQVTPNDFYGVAVHIDSDSASASPASPGKSDDFAASQQSEAA